MAIKLKESCIEFHISNDNFLNILGRYHNQDFKYIKNQKCIDLIPILISRGVLSIKPKDYIIKDIILSKQNEVYIETETEKIPVFIKNSGIKLVTSDINKKLLKYSNLKTVWHELYLELVVNTIKNEIHNRYYIYNKTKLLKRLLKYNWISKEYIRYGLQKIESDIGLKIGFIKNKNGVLIKQIQFKKLHIFNSSGSLKIAKMPWEETFPEEFIMDRLFIQGGDDGIVISDKSYMTAFVEVFPKYIPNGDNKFSSFIRGEGKTFEEAEESAFLKTRQIFNCKNHKWNRKGRTTGAAFCEMCDAFGSKILEPTTECAVCKIKTSEFDHKGKYYCHKCYYLINSNEISKGVKFNAHKKFFKNSILNKKILSKLQDYNLKSATNKQKKKLYLTLYQSQEEYQKQLYLQMDFPNIVHYIKKIFIKRNIKINDKLLNQRYSKYMNLYHPKNERTITSKEVIEILLQQD